MLPIIPSILSNVKKYFFILFCYSFYPTFFTTSCSRSCAPFISDCINVFRSRYKAARIAFQMYCSRILRYEYTRPVRMLQFSRAWCLACISSRNFIPRLSHVYTYPLLTTYANTLNRLLRPQNLLLRCIQPDFVLFL